MPGIIARSLMGALLAALPGRAEDWPAGVLTQMQKKLTAFDGVISDGFGGSVAAWGDVVVVGAPGDDSGTGSAYVFERNAGGVNAWGFVRKLDVTNASMGRFGASVSVHGDVIAVGAYSDAVGGNRDRGSVYVFDRRAGGPEGWGQVMKLVAPDGAVDDLFGTSVSLAADVLAVGAPGKDNQRGAAYLFHRGTGSTDLWTRVAKVVAADGTVSDQFGQSVSLSGALLAVGAPGDDGRQGSAYLFERSLNGPDTWWQAGKVTASERAGNDYFGRAVALAGRALAVGAQGDDAFRGAVYVFEREADQTPAVGDTNRWLQTVKLVASDRCTNGLFGCSVALDGGFVLCGARGNEAGHTERGCAYVFERYAGGAGAWGQTIKITASDGANNDRFGCAVALAGDLLAIGSDSDYGHASGSGSAFLFPRQARTWQLAGRVTSPDAAYGDHLGYACRLSDGGTLAAGAPDLSSASAVGAVDLFERDPTNHLWRRVMRIGAASTNYLGVAVGIDGDVLVAGAAGEVGGGTNAFQGAAYIHERNAGGAGRWGQVARLADADGEREDWFGCSVAVDGDTVVVGVKNDRLGSPGWPGSARLYQRHWGGTNAWGPVKSLAAPVIGVEDHFGASVDIDGDNVAIGAPQYRTSPMISVGSVFVFRRDAGGTNAWGQEKMLLAPVPVHDEYFGQSVSIRGDLLAVGAIGSDSGGRTNNGAVYLFERNRGGANAWGYLKTLYPVESRDYESFGGAVCVDGDLVLAATHVFGTSNSVHVFSRHAGGTNAFGRIARLAGFDTTIYDRFGYSLDASGGTLVIGAYQDTPDINAYYSGAVYVFEGLCYALPRLMQDAHRPPHAGFHTVLNNRYDLEYATNLAIPPAWMPVPGRTNIPGTGATLWTDDPGAGPGVVRFHRVQQRNP